MLKQKITSIIIGILMISGVMIGVNTLNNTKITNDNTKVVNKVLLSAPSSDSERAVVVNTDNSPLVLYSNASSNSSITSYISVGEMLTIESSGDNFYKVKVQETGAVGYISAHNLQIITSGVNDTYSQVNKQGYIINVSSRVNLRANATMNSNILNKLTNNTKINILGKQGQWYKVNCNGTVGYIYQEYVGLTDTNLEISNTKQSTNTLSPKTTKIKSSNNVHESSKINTNNNSISKEGYIKWVEPINPPGTPLSKYIFINLNSIVVKNTTGKNISDNLLAKFMRKWILQGQNSCMGIYGYENTTWLPQWLDKVTNNELIEAFIDANGKGALCRNITANEFNKATMKLYIIVSKKKEPFTLAQATKIIKQQLFPHEIITKIKPVQGGYYVYTKQSGNNIYVVVNGYNGNYIA